MIIRLRALLVASTDQDESIIHISVGIPPPSIDQVFSPPAGDNVQRILIIMLFASFVTGGLTNFASLLSFQNSNLCGRLLLSSHRHDLGLIVSISLLGHLEYSLAGHSALNGLVHASSCSQALGHETMGASYFSHLVIGWPW